MPRQEQIETAMQHLERFREARLLIERQRAIEMHASRIRQQQQVTINSEIVRQAMATRNSPTRQNKDVFGNIMMEDIPDE